MLKVDILAVRRADMTHEAFVAYWRDQHAALFARQPIVQKTVRRYVQSRVVAMPPGVPTAAFDGIVQLWFDDVAGFLEYAQSANYADVIRPDEERFVDHARTQLVFTEEAGIIDAA